MAKSWNPRYLAYCYPCSPQNQLALDRKLYPGGCMTGFILWVKARWREFDQIKGLSSDHHEAHRPPLLDLLRLRPEWDLAPGARFAGAAPGAAELPRPAAREAQLAQHVPDLRKAVAGAAPICAQAQDRGQGGQLHRAATGAVGRG
jgi:hypothetical protein